MFSSGGWLFEDRDKGRVGADKSESGLQLQNSAEAQSNQQDRTDAEADHQVSSTAIPHTEVADGADRSVPLDDADRQDAEPAAQNGSAATDTTPADQPHTPSSDTNADPPTQPKPVLSSTTSSSAPPTRSTLPTSLLTPPHPTDPLSSSTLIVPPLNFAMVSRGIYRSGHPNERNFEFLRRLSLRTVLYLGTEDYRPNMTAWTSSQNITFHHLRLAINKEPLAEMDESDVVKALQLILTPANWPILIHCNKGKYRVGCIVGLVRRLQGWSHTSIFEEYSRFAGTKISDLEFIEVFDLDKVSLTG
ncbi:putative Inositol phosphatase SIW14 (putative) [Pseudozyma hubeiensis]|nr:putative Inositol phosphatase SIW14 (putative) [Pseudozyma hubeiensis]